MSCQPRIRYTVEARRDLRRCRQFLRRHSPGSVRFRMRELMEGVRTLREFPEMNRVRQAIPGSALPLRRHNVGQFVIAYVYLRPNESEPNGLISLRAFRHAGTEDALWMVREPTVGEISWTFLSTRERDPLGAYNPLATYGEITFSSDDPFRATPTSRSLTSQSFSAALSSCAADEGGVSLQSK